MVFGLIATILAIMNFLLLSWLRSDVKEIRSDLRSRTSSLKSELKSEMSDLKSEFKNKNK